MATKIWKKGRGKLGFLQPLLGNWRAEADSEMGPVKCERVFKQVLDGAYVKLQAKWSFKNGGYEEIAIIGADQDGTVRFWSFTSDKKRSEGELADVTDIHPEAVGFEAQMPAGLARMAYWPDEAGGFFWVVESKTKKGWNRFTEHHYQPV